MCQAVDYRFHRLGNAANFLALAIVRTIGEGGEQTDGKDGLRLWAVYRSYRMTRTIIP